MPQKKREKFCFGCELLRLLCNGSAGLFDVGKVSASDDFDNSGRFPKANESLLFECLRAAIRAGKKMKPTWSRTETALPPVATRGCF